MPPGVILAIFSPMASLSRSRARVGEKEGASGTGGATYGSSSEIRATGMVTAMMTMRIRQQPTIRVPRSTVCLFVCVCVSGSENCKYIIH